MTKLVVSGLSHRGNFAALAVCVAAMTLTASPMNGSNVAARGKDRTSVQTANPVQTPAVASAPRRNSDAALGQALFTGQKTLQNGGPACSTCHGIANFSVPHGATPGADLTHEYSTMGSDALARLLTRPPFPPMQKLYQKNPLTPVERRELIAFLKREDEAKLAVLAPAPTPPSPEEIGAGEALFDGRMRMQNGGPACATCHTAAGIPFPFGGTMGPDLTREYSKLGPQGMAVALKTLYFPAMNPLFEKRPLTESEQNQLAAFFQSIDQKTLPPSPDVILFAASIVLLAIFFLWTWLAVGRRRVRSVRRALLERAGASKGSRR